MEKTIITVALCVLAALMLAMIVKVVKGPRFTDRILAVNAINTMLTTDGPYLLEVAIMQGENVMPMTPPGGAVNVMMMSASDC